MKLSAKTRYGIASMLQLALKHGSGELRTVSSISEDLGISKIYLEQVFSLIKRADLVVSIKGSKGGYQLKKAPREISVYEIVGALEHSLFEKSPDTVKEKAPHIERALKCEVQEKLDQCIEITLKNVSLSDLVNCVIEQQNCGYMYYL